MRAEDLVSIVGKLAEKYTSGESTSVTYETAEKLMGAVIYCIREAERNGCDSSVGKEPWEEAFSEGGEYGAHAGNGMGKRAEGQTELRAQEEMTAEQKYEKGLEYVEEKTKRALALYNELLPDFLFYENQCLYDTVVKGLPEFFKWYDIRFEPQNTIITLDYPVLRDLSDDSGIDRIFEFIRCIRLEQEFLSAFPTTCVTGWLKKYNREYRETADNICETVLGFLFGHVLAGKALENELDEADYLRLQQIFMKKDPCDIMELLRDAVEVFAEKCSGDGRGFLAAYLSGAVENIAVRMKNAAEHGALQRMC